MRHLLLFCFGLLTAAPALLGQVIREERPEFRALVPEGATVERLATGFQFLEGPAWEERTGSLIFSDIPAGRMYRFDPAAPAGAPPPVFREPSQHANGNAFDAAGNLLTGEEGGRRVSRTSPDGRVETLADRFEGKALNSPNDVAVRRDGTIWFTDPTYGLGKTPREQTANRVYCLDLKTGDLRAALEDFDQPNGLCFSPDDTRLYVVDTGRPRHIRVFDVDAAGGLTHGRVFCALGSDGIRCDRRGNVWASADDGVQVFNPAGERLGRILLPEAASNLCFGGRSGNDLYVAARTSLYRVKVSVNEDPAPAGTD